MSRHPDEIHYANVCDELNDVPNQKAMFPPITLEDLDTDAVAGAERFAKANDFPWPPGVGDFDRYYEWARDHR